MDRSSLATVVGTALTAACLTLTGAKLLLPATAAGGGAEAGPALQPPFQAAGASFSLKLDPATAKPGCKPTGRLTVTNRGDKPVAIEATLRMLAAKPASPHARMVAFPQEKWSHQMVVKLQPGETRTVALNVTQPVPAGHTASFLLQVGNESGKLAEIVAEPVRLQQTLTPAADTTS